MSVRSVVSDASASDEELELWARTLDLPGFEDNVSPHNTITSLVRVTLGEIVLHLPRSQGFQVRPSSVEIGLFCIVYRMNFCVQKKLLQCDNHERKKITKNQLL